MSPSGIAHDSSIFLIATLNGGGLLDSKLEGDSNCSSVGWTFMSVTSPANDGETQRLGSHQSYGPGVICFPQLRIVFEDLHSTAQSS